MIEEVKKLKLKYQGVEYMEMMAQRISKGKRQQ